MRDTSLTKAHCNYKKVSSDGYGADWTTGCRQRVRCEAPIEVGISFPPLPNESGKFCHYCGKEIFIKSK